MLRPWLRTCRRLRFPRPRPLCSSCASNSQHRNSVECTKDKKNHSPIVHAASNGLSPLSSAPSTSRTSLLATASAVFVSAAAISYLLLSGDTKDADSGREQLFSTIEHSIDRSKESAYRIINRMKHTGIAASVLWQSLRSVFSSANQEVRSGFEFRVASFLADIAAVNASRRAAIVVAGGGKVIDWLLETVAVAGEGNGTQAEAARALAYLIADPIVRDEVFARPHAVPYLMRSIFSSQPHHRSKKNSRRTSLNISDSLNGGSMLIAAIMDVVTSNCESLDNALLHSSLPAHADMSDIAAAIQVIEGGMTVDDPQSNDDDDGGKGLKGIGIKVLGDTAVVGFSRNSGTLEYTSNGGYKEPREYIPEKYLVQNRNKSFLSKTNLSSAVVPGLWDDLHTQHVAVPFAAWALANWALASEENRIHIKELDSDGHAITTALSAPERSVKWHGSLVARLLLEDKNLPLNDFVCDWSTSLLSTIAQACIDEDIPLAKVALATFLLSVEKSAEAKKVVMDKGLPIMRKTAKLTPKHKNVQEALAKALELINAGDLHLSLEESERWSGILLPWACGRSSSKGIQSSATYILSRILEDYGPSTVPISLGWLTIILSEVLASTKSRSQKDKIQPKADEVKTQVNQSNISSAALITNQLASAVVNLAGNRLETPVDSAGSFPFEDLLLQEPFAEPFKKLNKQRNKFHVADFAGVTLKGIKALAEVCTDDPLCQNIATDSGVLCLLRRFLLRDDYEKLAAMEAYDASRTRETQDQASNDPGDEKVSGAADPSSVRIPPTAHMRRHAARLLTILSALPKVQKVIIGDEIWCTWLEDCANGRIPGCHDLKLQSYARAILLNVLCNGKDETGSGSGDDSDGDMTNYICNTPLYDDMIFLINPGSPHWKCPDKRSSEETQSNIVERLSTKNGDYVDGKDGHSENFTNEEEDPPLDVVFVHGLRGGPFKSWRISEDKSSTKSGLVEKIDQEAGKQGTFWPGEWLSADFPHARLFSLKYKSSLTQWSGASLPLQEVSSMLLQKLIAAGIGSRPVVFVTHSMGGLVVKQMLHQARQENLDHLVNSTIGIVFYSCPHFGSRLADMPWRMGLVLRPAPTVGELRRDSPRLIELNEFIHQRHNKGFLDVLNFSETEVTPIVEGYGGWAIRLHIVPEESADPGYGDVVKLKSTDHINSCKPLSKDDPSYIKTLQFLRKLKAQYT